MRFRPCIDLKDGKVVQIVGETLSDDTPSQVATNFTSEKEANYYASLYRRDNLPGGHVISLGPGNQESALQALAAYPGGLHYGGGVTPDNAEDYLNAGASHVIATSYLFENGTLSEKRLGKMAEKVGTERLVLDLSCRKRDGIYWVVADRWKSFTDLRVDAETLEKLALFCAEFLVHGVDVEGHRAGIDEELVGVLGKHAPLPVTYAGGAKSLDDLDRVEQIGQGRVDLTIGSALDIFGGEASYKAAVAWHKSRLKAED